MSNSTRLSDLLHRTYFGPAWHGSGLAEILAGASSETAAASPAAGTHSIWQLALHILAWKEEVRRRLIGLGRKLTPAENWPPVTDTSASAWQSTILQLATSQQALEQAVLELSEERLAMPMGDAPGTIEDLIQAIIHHDLYHAGQIAILKAGSPKTA